MVDRESSKKEFTLTLNYAPSALNEPRWGYGKPAHPLLYNIINKKRGDYERLLLRFLDYKTQYLAISQEPDLHNPNEPCLANSFFPVLDSLALYAILATYRPARYVEVGSGMSTKFARRAIKDYSLKTRIISVDPEPRADINALCDQVWRIAVELVDHAVFDQLESGDVLFVDGSHRCFMNSDVTVLFLEIIPRLKPGVLVELHDVFLPWDYPLRFADRYYNEQYLLAAYLLAGNETLDIMLPNAFVRADPQLMRTLDPILESINTKDRATRGSSCWLARK